MKLTVKMNTDCIQAVLLETRSHTCIAQSFNTVDL